VVDFKAKLPPDFEEVDSSEYTIRRILNGIPEGKDDFFPMMALPIESNLDYTGGGTFVTFVIGCQ